MILKTNLWLQMFLKAFVLFLTLATGSSQSEADGKSNAIVEKYIALAFEGKVSLQTFDRPPLIEIVCSSRASCQQVATRVREIIPGEFELIKSDVATGRADIIIFLFHSAEMAIARKATEDYESSDQSLAHHNWGPEECEVHQFLRGNSVRKLIISASLDEPSAKNLVCIFTELARGSGGGGKSSYDLYSSGVLSYSEKHYRAFLSGISFFLKVHWSGLVSPGMSSSVVREVLLPRLTIK